MAKELPTWKKEAKKRFLTEFNNYLRDTNKSLQKIEQELGISLSTIKDTIRDEDGPNFNADFVIAFCLKYKTVDINFIYTGIRDDAPAQNQTDGFTTFRHSLDCHPLEDEVFMGTYYGYCRNTQYSNIIDDFVLTIGKTHRNSVEATLQLNSHNQKMQTLKKTLYGKPMHLEPNIIYIVFQSEKSDDMFIMSYNWFKINTDQKLYCRYGGMITPCRATDRFPQIESFLLLDKPVAKENLDYVDGFLNLVQDKIIVPAHLYDKEKGGILETNPMVKEFFEQCRDMQYNKEEYYCFSEKVLLALGEANNVEFDTIAATIMSLRQISVNPKVVNYPNNKTFSKFLSGLTVKDE